jgi:glycine/D-amino acid oxidase-like deaminating enzyme
MYDVAVIGAGIAGMATAARLQAHGLSTIVCDERGERQSSQKNPCGAVMLRRLNEEPACPPLASLGEHLLITTPDQRWLARVLRAPQIKVIALGLGLINGGR